MIPKAELHCHIEGAASPDLVQRLAARHNVDLGGIIVDGAYQWHDFSSFLDAYDTASTVFQTRDDYRLLAFEHFKFLATQGCIYAEVISSPDHAARQGLSYDAMLEGIVSGMEAAREETGIEGRVQVTCLRHLGPERAAELAKSIASMHHPMVTGFNIAGDERLYEISEFTKAFEIATAAGLGLTAHAGELCGADSVRNTLDHVPVSRIGHGVRAIEDFQVVEMLVERAIVLEVCPGSNLALGVFDTSTHPINALRDAGVAVTLNSDDPPFFHTSLQHEYDLARDHFGFDEATLLQTTRTALEAAFVDEVTRQRLLKRLEERS